MERKAAIACCYLLLLAVVAATGAVPAAVAAPAAGNNKNAAAAWVEDAAVGIDLQLVQAMVLAAAAVGGVDDDDHEVVHRRVLQARGGYVDPSLVADRQRCIGSCSRPGRPYTGRGNLCIFHNRSC